MAPGDANTGKDNSRNLSGVTATPCQFFPPVFGAGAVAGLEEAGVLVFGFGWWWRFFMPLPVEVVGFLAVAVLADFWVVVVAGLAVAVLVGAVAGFCGAALVIVAGAATAGLAGWALATGALAGCWVPGVEL